VKVAHWDTDPTPWDTCYLDGAALPGIATVEVSAGRKIDDRSASGRNGSSLVDKGQKAANVTINLQLWTEEHLTAWGRVQPSLSYRQERLPAARPGTKTTKATPAADRNGLRRERRAVAISHTVATLNDIRLVYVSEIRTNHPKGGVLNVTITCLETHQEKLTTSVTRTLTASSGRFGRTGVAFRPPSEGDTGPSQ
jgi:hypothetical protein